VYCPTFLYVQLPGEAARPAGGDVEGVVVGPTQPLTVPALHLHTASQSEMSSIFADNSVLENESQCGGMGGGGCGVSANEYSCAHHVEWSPNKLWRFISIFKLTYAGNQLESFA
jgi:hypothetical protein